MGKIRGNGYKLLCERFYFDTKNLFFFTVRTIVLL